MNFDRIQKTALIVNAVILALVFALMGFFNYCDVTFMTWFSIPTAAVYLLGFWLIARDKLDIYVWMVYGWLTLYMCLSTVCLGYGYGFHLYCFSMIPIIFVTEYLSYKLHRRSMRANHISIAIAAAYLISTGYTAYNGPVYQIEQRASAYFWIGNALTVFCFLIYYSDYLVNAVISSEEKLSDMAHKDRLTGLYNRHYMLDYLDEKPAAQTGGFLAIADIDDFKKINDHYGHNAGDAVLKAVAKQMQQGCEGCLTARWGGEEFLIVSEKPFAEGKALLETMRQEIAGVPVQYEDQTIRVTLTVGISERQPEQSVDAWIQDADSKLYTGKKNGKNQVVS